MIAVVSMNLTEFALKRTNDWKIYHLMFVNIWFFYSNYVGKEENGKNRLKIDSAIYVPLDQLMF